MRIAAIIPARYASTRFPAKPLALIAGKPMIVHVLQRVAQVQAIQDLFVATDHQGIFDLVEAHGYRAIMTSVDAASGTDRLAEAARQEAFPQVDYIINIQGDEPLIASEHLEKIIALVDGKTALDTLKKAIHSQEELLNPNVVKVACNLQGEALYFSRHPLPYLRGVDSGQWLEHGLHFKHIGLYAYRYDILQAISELAPSPLEKAESLEQLRWLENGYRIQTATTTLDSIGVDTPEDVSKVEHLLSK